MHSPEIVRGVENLSRIADITGDAFRHSLRELKSQVDKLMGISKTPVGIINGLILFDELRCGYVDEQMSLSDLARRYNCTRQYIHKLLKHYGIERRNKSAARALALNRKRLESSSAKKHYQQTVFQDLVT